MKFKSKHESTISFTAKSFETLLSKDWATLSCHMASGRVVELTRSKITYLWGKSRDWRKVPYSATMVKVIPVD